MQKISRSLIFSENNTNCVNAKKSQSGWARGNRVLKLSEGCVSGCSSPTGSTLNSGNLCPLSNDGSLNMLIVVIWENMGVVVVKTN